VTATARSPLLPYALTFSALPRARGFTRMIDVAAIVPTGFPTCAWQGRTVPVGRRCCFSARPQSPPMDAGPSREPAQAAQAQSSKINPRTLVHPSTSRTPCSPIGTGLNMAQRSHRSAPQQTYNLRRGGSTSPAPRRRAGRPATHPRNRAGRRAASSPTLSWPFPAPHPRLGPARP
jgi:hypothetical protein